MSGPNELTTVAAASGTRLERLDSHAVIERLAQLRSEHPDGILAFDADGTLWRGDVGDELYFALLERSVLRSEGESVVRAHAAAAGLDAQADAHALGAQLFAEYRAGRFDEHVMCEVIAQACAGFPSAEIAAFAAGVVAGIRERLQPEVMQILAWARASAVDVYVVSASPRPVVVEGVAHLEIPASRVIAATLLERDGVLQPHLAKALPYGPRKQSALREQTKRPLLAAFGDSAFDLALLSDATLPMAVRPKPSLLARASELTRLRELTPES